jgi:C4-dicarboxylate-specific signal transduction histidine kinase
VSASQGRLIVVDDEPAILELLASVFAGDRWDVVTCASGRAAIEAMRGGVDVLLTDKNLPDVGGLDLIKHARTVTADAEALVITGYASLDTALLAMELGVFDYIVKPPRDIFDVKRKVAQAFEKQHLARENRRLLLDLQAKNAELEAALDELRDTQAELIQAEKLAGIGTLAAGIAHEISSPLFGVMGLAEAIREEDDLGLIQGYAGDIVDYSRAIKDIVVELSGYSRTADNEYLTTIDLQRVVEDAVRLVTRSAPCDGVTVVQELTPSLFIHARTNEIQQVFVNLVKNALEAVNELYEGKRGRIVVSTGHGDGFVWARVADDGPGIPADKQAVIFDPFYTTKPPGKGTGLGLNIVYRILTKYRGTIAVESAGGGGAVFLVKFPVDPA